MATPLVCLFCDQSLQPHCQNSWCNWAECQNCRAFGVPEENRWRRPIQAKDDERR